MSEDKRLEQLFIKLQEAETQRNMMKRYIDGIGHTERFQRAANIPIDKPKQT